MNAKLKPILIALGSIAAILVVSQLALGLLIVNGGASPNIVKLIKAHQHSGYLTVTVVLLYIAASLTAIARTPAHPKN